MGTAMHYPVNYGYVPQTLAGDGDPVDVLVMTPFPLPSGVVVPCRAIGILLMEDDGGVDGKVLAVAHQEDLACLRQDRNLGRCARADAEPDPALLRALQGSGKGQVGEDPRLEGRGRSQKGNHGRHRQLQQSLRGVQASLHFLRLLPQIL